MKSVTYGSVCSGIEAASVAWEPLHWKPYWFSEIEPFPSTVLKRHWPKVRNHGDFTKIAKKILDGKSRAPDVLVGGCPCFTAGQQVLTDKGYVNIEHIKVGDLVVSHTGMLRKVVKTGHEVKSVGRLSVVGNPEGLVCTPDHPYLSCIWKVQNTRKNGAHYKNVTITEPEWIPAKDMVGRQWCALQNFHVKPKPFIGDRWSQKEAMIIAGWYLGDGWVRGHDSKKKKVITFGLNSAKLKAFTKLFSGRFGVSEDRTCYKIRICDTKLAEWLLDNFGHGAESRHIPAWLMSSKFRKHLLEGYLNTDGHKYHNGKWDANSVSRSLSFGIRELAQTCGYTASVGIVRKNETTVIEGRTVNQKDYWSVRAIPEDRSRKSRKAKSYLLRGATYWQNTGKSTVYNIEVETDHSYIVDGVIVHNCQAFSVAGKRKSLQDARGNLTLSFVLLADAIDLKRKQDGKEPAIILFENVPGILNVRDNAFGCLLAGLAGEDEELKPPGGRWSNAGYVLGPQRAVAWRVLDSQFFGVPQRRRRVFVMASAGTINPLEVLFESESLRRHSQTGQKQGKETSSSASKIFARSGKAEALDHNRPTVKISDTVCANANQCTGRQSPEVVACTLRRSPQQDDNTLIPFTINSYTNCTYEQCSRANALTTSVDRSRGGPVVVMTEKPYQQRTNSLCASDHKGISNQYVTDHKCIRTKNTTFRDVTDCLTAAYGTKWNGNASATNGSLFVRSKAGVRRLTPTECARLQGFPDGHARVSWRGKKRSQCPDQPQYKAYGNSMAVPVMRWIGTRIQMALNGELNYTPKQIRQIKRQVRWLNKPVNWVTRKVRWSRG